MLTLKAEQDQKDVSIEYNKMHDFVSGLLQKASQGAGREKNDYKIFSFSNIFPYGDVKEGDIRKLVIASPSRQVIKRLRNVLKKKIWSLLTIGESRFFLEAVQEFGMSVGAPLKILCATPVIIRIPESMYETCHIPEKERWQGYTYWRPGMAPEVFASQLSENLIRKYNNFHGTRLSHPALIEEAKFRRPVFTRLTLEDGKSEGVAASMWEFKWTKLDGVQKKILEFSLDAGFGERNEMGFGFVNVMRERR